MITTIEACMARLRPIIDRGKPDEFGAAERAMDEFTAGFADPHSTTGALHVLEDSLEAVASEVSGASLAITDRLVDRVRGMLRDLRNSR